MRKLDRTDIGILNSLQENARITNAELARSVNLSPTPCFNRVRAMEELGVIRQQVTLLSPEVMECYLMTGDPDYLLRVLLPSIQALERFLDYLTRLPGVANIRSSFALKQVRYKTALPLPANGMTLRE